MKPKRYPSDLTRTQWQRLRRQLPPAKPGGRPRSVKLREILNGIFYIVRGGCAWRMMPKDFPPWSTCYDYFYKWRNDGTWQTNNQPRPEAVVLGRPPRGGRLREVAPVGGVDLRATPAIPGRSATACPTGSRARPCVFLASSFGVAELQSFLGGKHAGSLEALRVTRPKAVDLEGININKI